MPGDTTPDLTTGDHTAAVPVVNHAWKPSDGGKIQTELAIVLENVAAGYAKPNILDVKLGARLWADDSPPEKRVKLDKVAEETTSKPLGFRIAGMKAYHGPQETGDNHINADGYRVFDKHYGRSLSVETVGQGFQEFFRVEDNVRPPAPIRKVIKRFMEDLEILAKSLKSKESRMYSASLLFVYEGDFDVLEKSFTREADLVNAYNSRQNLENNAEPNDTEIQQNDDFIEDNDSDGHGQPDFPSIQNLKLIDFAHAHWAAGQGPDENLLHGVRNVIEILRGLLG